MGFDKPNKGTRKKKRLKVEDILQSTLKSSLAHYKFDQLGSNEWIAW